MALLSSGTAVAGESSDDIAGAGGTGVVQAGPERTATAVPDADTDGAHLEAALSGPAAAALGLFNQIRVANGLKPMRADGTLTGMAQTWATQMANERAMREDPDLNTGVKPLPGHPVPSSIFVEYGVWGEGSPSSLDLADWASRTEPGSILQANVNHIGIGWSVNGHGEGFLYWIAVEYDFTDIGPGDTFYDAVDFLAFNGISTGYPDGGFHPTGTVSREAMAAFLYRFVNITTTIPTCAADTPRMFTDVTAGHPFCGAIEWLADQGITTGYPDGTFKPGANVTREAMAAFLYRAFQDATIPACVAGPRTFTDVSTGHPFCGAIEWLSTSGITTGWPDHTFRPGLSVERQAMAAFLYRLS